MNDFNQGYRGDSDLLSQIAAEDEVVVSAPQKKKKPHSIIMHGVILFMKLTFLIDDAKRKYEKVFSVLGYLWATFMVLVYLGGVAMLGLLVYSYITFPDTVRKTLQEQKIFSKNYNIDEISLSKVVLSNLEDKDGAYTIKKMTVESTFSDFVRYRVKSVVLDDVKIKVTEDKDGIKFGTLPEVLVNLNQGTGKKALKIDKLSINKAILEINGQDYAFPVSFSVTGIYSKDSQVSIPLYIEEKFANIDAALSISGTKKKMDFVLKIKAGTLTIPKRSPENIRGEIKVSSKNMVIDKINGNLQFVYGKDEKKINIDMTNGKKGYSGTLSANFSYADSSVKNGSRKSAATVQFSDMVFSSFHRFKTTEPLTLNVQSFEKQGINIKRLNSTLNGDLSCDSFVCSYTVQKDSKVFIKEMSLDLLGDNVKTGNEFTFTLVPNKKESFRFDGQKLVYDVSTAKFNFSGFRNTSIYPISMMAEKLLAKGSYDTLHGTKNMKMDAEKLAVTTPEVVVQDAIFHQDDIFADNSLMKVDAGSVKIDENDILKEPFKLSMQKKGLQTTAKVSLDNDLIVVSFSGTSRLLLGEFKGNVYIAEFDLGKSKKNLDEISDLFPNGLKKVSGKMAVLGTVDWKNNKQISGPLHISLRDVGFEKGGITVSGLNTVLSFQTLRPMVSANNQAIFVQKVKGAVPMQNIFADIKIDNQFLRVLSAKATLAGTVMAAEPATFSLRANSVVLGLKSNDVNLEKLSSYLKLYDIQAKGRGALSFSLEAKSGNLFVKDGKLDISSAVLDLSGVKNEAVKTYFGSVKEYVIRSGSIFIDSNEQNNLVNFNISLDGRLMPMGEMKNVRKTMDISLNELVKPVKAEKVPDTILKKQNIIQ
ncbi:MAG: hypothetical protein IKY98_04090 [Alphaproteobacteria bacterium]|nr:hypothetical protein [Alphaproteobacteria bacterium]